MQEVSVIEDRAVAEAWLDPVRGRLLAELKAEPASATALAGRLGIPRQKINYHLRTLEKHGLVEVISERRKGNMTERVLRASAGSYVISPGVAPEFAPDPDLSPDRTSARWMLALAARLVRDIGSLLRNSAKADKKVATWALDAQVTFASPQERAAFATELGESVTKLLAKYHADTGRTHRIVIAVHPKAD